ncbi:MAG: hypothetical protein HYZ28_10705 [Myxococcales bacterium]|nr:hypothetical protein [Myxococcales bacterium]
MTAAELTYAAILRLLRDLHRDQAAIGQQAEEIERQAAKLAAGLDGSAAAVLALALHHYFTAFETALSRAVRTLEGELPEGPDWHLALFAHAAMPLEPLRPALVSRERLPALSELRRFRHFLRNAYAVTLDPARLVDLANLVRVNHPGLVEDLSSLLRFVEQVRDRLVRLE